ncbi:hypothetical protein [Plantactinospora soyae]|uniref:Uncharacterized protein n=1 Tax=Plantactinospora soyae TaxID=1544732 RepID=A0A927M2F8_9ACTN|nr:hypothetical protein [Plantactinospora soyae]MBE1485600.1 hypothetical protein [Plantactinospora soyae]
MSEADLSYRVSWQGPLLQPLQVWLRAGNLQAIRRIQKASDSSDPLTARVDEVQGHLQEIAALLPVLEAELQMRNATLERVRADAVRYERLAALDRDKAETVEKLVDETVKRGVREAVKTLGEGFDEATRMISFGIDQSSKAGRKQQIQYFLLGLAGSVPLGVAGNFLFEWLTK